MTPRTEPLRDTRAHRIPACGYASPTLPEPQVDARPHRELFTRVRFLRESAAYLGLSAAGVGLTAVDASGLPGVRTP